MTTAPELRLSRRWRDTPVYATQAGHEKPQHRLSLGNPGLTRTRSVSCALFPCYTNHPIINCATLSGLMQNNTHNCVIVAELFITTALAEGVGWGQ